MKPFKIIAVIFAAVFFFPVHAQLELQTCVTDSRNAWEWPGHNNWFIGTFSGASNVTGKMINFQAGFTKSTTGSTTIGQGTPVYEGVTTMSDDLGNLIAFSNGRWAWDKNSNIVSKDIKEGNEGGFNIVGSASQGIICVRHPLTPKKYYMITTGDVIGGANPQVTYNQFNELGVETQGPTSLGVNSAEGITATFHENEVDIWVSVLGYSSTTLYSWLLTCDGFVNPPVTTNLGYAQANDAGRGGIAFSHSGEKFVACFPNAWPNADRQVVFYDFDRKTGKFSNREDKGPTAVVVGPYDVVFSKDDSKVIVTGGNAGGVHSVNVATGAYKKETSGFGLPLHHAVEIGGDGNYYFNGKDGLWRWSGSGSFDKVDASTGQGLPSMYIPPAEEPDIVEVGPFCDTASAVDLHTYWVCSGLSAEDSIYQRHLYSGTGITDDKVGTFDPALAGPGTHEIIFTYCDVNDTIWIDVAYCPTCEIELKDDHPELCVGEQIRLDTLIEESNGDRFWSIISAPATANQSAIITTAGDTLFDASDLGTHYGTYQLQLMNVKDILDTCYDSIYITVNPLPEPDLGNDTSICIDWNPVTFDAGSFTAYDWATDGGDVQTITVSDAKEYIVEVTDAKGCKEKDTVELFINQLPTIDLGDDLEICAGDPAVTFDAESATPGMVSYTWEDNAVANTKTKNEAGIYKVVLEDKFGCLDSDEVELTINALPIVDLGNDTSICTGSGTVTFDASKSAPGMNYLWGDGSTNSTFETDVAGEYIVEITDGNQCSDTDSVVLVVNSFVQVDMGPDKEICFGDSTLTLNAQIAGAQAYLWQPTLETTQVITTDIAGEYSVALIDSNGCPGMDTINVIINTLPVVDLGADQEICTGDPAVTFDAQNAGATYVWSPDAETAQTIDKDVEAEYIVEITDANGCKDTDSVYLTVHDLPVVDLGADQEICQVDPEITLDAGHPTATFLWSGTETTQTLNTKVEAEYSVIVTDTNGCIGHDTMYLTVNPMPIVSMADQEICLGDPAVTFDVGADFDTYSWKSGATTKTITTDVDGEHIVTFTDDKGCSGNDTVVLTVHALPVPDLGTDQTICADANEVSFTPGTFDAYAWSDNSSGASLSTKVAGIYTVEVTDANGCKESDEVELIVIDLPTPDVILDVTMCPGMTSTFDASVYDDGNGPYTYAWSDGSTAGTYISDKAESIWVDISNAYNCTARDLATVSINSDLTVSIIGAPLIELCDGEDTDLIPNYKSADGYNLAWSTGESSDVINVNASGTYDLHVDNGLGCEGDGTIDVIVHPNPVVNPTPQAVCDGLAAVIGDNQGATFDYSWDNGETTPTISVLTAGTFTQTLTNKTTGCIGSAPFDVAIHSNPTPNLGSDVRVCTGIPVVLSDISGQAIVAQTWSNGEKGTSISPTTNGDYSITVETAEGCVGTSTVNVDFIPIPTVDLGPDINLCEGESAMVDAGNETLSISWNTGQTTSTFTVNQTNTHIVTISDNGCNARDTINVNVVPLPTSFIDKSLAVDPICFTEDDRGIAVDAGANEAYTYLWSSGETTSNINVEEPGTYIVDISVGNCSITDHIQFTEYCPSTLFIPNAFTPDGDGINDSFNAQGTYITDYQMYIYNRWGELIYTSESMTDDWDGTYFGSECQIDVYVYKIYYTVNHPDGHPRSEQKTGRVTLIR